MAQRIYISSPDVGAAEEAALIRALRSGWVAPLGPEVEAFEDELAARTQRRFAVALSSGTAALHLALLNWVSSPRDLVITSTMTFAATANAIVYTGAQPVFIDCDATGNMDATLLEEAIIRLRNEGARVAAILPVDLLGKVADYETIERLAEEHAIPILADAAEALGAVRCGRQAGSFGQAAALSFNGNKIITTSGGGALVTDDPAIATRTRYLATQARQSAAHYEHTEIGYNYRMSNILAALGRAQLGRLDHMLERRRYIRALYGTLFSDVLGVDLFGDDGSNSSGSDTKDNCWLTSILVNEDRAGWHARELMHHLDENDIESRPLWKPMHAQPVFKGRRAFLNGRSDAFFESGLALPSGSVLTDSQIQGVASCINSFLRLKGQR